MALMFRSVLQNAGGAAELIVTCDSEFAGATISCSDGTTTLNKTCPSSSPYEVTFKIPNSGDWTISATVSGTAYTSDPISVELDYTALLEYGFNWRRWVDTARFLDSTDYNSLEEVLADEKAVRELCLEHNCVDFLADITTANEDVETIINTDLFAKWVNNSDYSLDTLGANVAIKALMDTADKYGYGEWALVGQVPKMTSATSPYGTVSASSYYNSQYLPYYAFDGDDTKYWYSTDLATNNYLQYEFVTAIKPSKVSVLMTIGPTSGKTVPSRTFVVKGSNDGFVNDSHDLGSFTTDATTSSITETFRANIDDGSTYKYLRLFCADTVFSNGNFSFGIRGIQFYAYAPKGNVPKMTSNTAPYGNVLYSDTYGSNSFYNAFDGSLYGAWSNLTNAYGGYKFVNPVCVKRIYMRSANAAQYGTISVKLQASNDGFVNDIHDLLTTSNFGSLAPVNGKYTDIENDDYYLSYRFLQTNKVGDASGTRVDYLQFYGRELSVSVPTMTGNTTPYGTVYALTKNHGASGREGWKAFDGNDNTAWWGAFQNNTTYVQYDFGKTIQLAKCIGRCASGSSDSQTFKVIFEYSMDNVNWYAFGDEISKTGTGIFDISTDNGGNTVSARYVRCRTTYSSFGTGAYTPRLQFYALDYSEKEFEEGTTKKWLYDHGVELETINVAGTVTKGTDAIQLTAANAQATASVNTTAYSLVRGKVGAHASGTNQLICGSGASNFTANNMPYNNGFDVSSVNGSNAVGVKQTAVGIFDATELWLE